MSRTMAVHRIRCARERLKAARLLLGERFQRDSVSRSYWSALHSLWALLELNGIPCLHSRQVFSTFRREGDPPPEMEAALTPLFCDLLESAREEEVGDFFKMDAQSAAHLYRNAEKILETVEEVFKARRIKF